jgi:hypothetical protein
MTIGAPRRSNLAEVPMATLHTLLAPALASLVACGTSGTGDALDVGAEDGAAPSFGGIDAAGHAALDAFIGRSGVAVTSVTLS